MIERRYFPRYPCEKKFKICSRLDDDVLDDVIDDVLDDVIVQASDISEAGISFTTDAMTISQLTENGCPLEIGNRIQIAFPGDPSSIPTIECQVMHSRRLSQQHYLIGLWFSQLTDSALKTINQLVKNASQSAEE